jgi:hypothetical protein
MKPCLFFKVGNAFTHSTVLFLSTWMLSEIAQGYAGLLGLAPRLPTKPHCIPPAVVRAA